MFSIHPVFKTSNSLNPKKYKTEIVQKPDMKKHLPSPYYQNQVL